MIDYNEDKINVDQALRELQKDEYANWSHEAATALVKWIEEYEEETGETAVLDPIALRCTYSEYTETELEETYSLTLEEIQEQTTVLELFKGTLHRNFIVQEF